MPSKNKRISQYLRKGTHSDSQNTQQPLQTTSPLSKFYRSINELPLYRFIDAVVDNNIYALVQSGTPSHDELATAWNDILDQYANANAGNDHKHYVNLYREVSILTLQYNSIQQWVEGMRIIYYAPFAILLNKTLRQKFKFDPTQPTEYAAELNRCINRSKSIRISIDLKDAALKQAKGKHESESKPTREYFQSVLITLSDYAKYELNDNMTVFAYCERFKRLVEGSRRK